MKKNTKKTIATVALIATLGITGISAYLTDTDSATNNFTVGKVEIELQEPNWNPDNGTDITPNKEIDKDPKVLNTGVNDAYIFAEVTVPYDTVITANDDGTKNPAAETELFSYTVNEGWIQMSQTKDEASKTVKHLYAYATGDATSGTMTAVAKDTETSTIFDSVTFANVIEGQGLEATSKNVDVKAYAIQTTDINGGLTTPEGVWQVVDNQVNK